MTDQAAFANGDRPLVTLVVFAYFQEAFVREAIEAAFAQTYQPLEIILSDDCSRDATFEIMQEMAAGYDGPHRVIARQNSVNVATALHLQLAFEASAGALIVIAAGDDISTSDRVEVLTEAWAAAGRPDGVLHSGRETFRDGETVGFAPPKRSKYSGRELEGFAHAQWLPAAAPTCAYTRGVFDRFPPLLGGSVIEDAPLLMRAALLGTFIACDKPLVRHRVHDDNAGTGYGLDRPARWNRFIQSKIIAFRTMQRDLAGWEGEIDPRLRRRIEDRILTALHSASGLMLPETRPLGTIGKIRLALRISTSLAVASSLRLRIEYALSFFGVEAYQRLKTRVRGVIVRNRRIQ